MAGYTAEGEGTLERMERERIFPMWGFKGTMYTTGKNQERQWPGYSENKSWHPVWKHLRYFDYSFLLQYLIFLLPYVCISCLLCFARRYNEKVHWQRYVPHDHGNEATSAKTSSRHCSLIYISVSCKIVWTKFTLYGLQISMFDHLSGSDSGDSSFTYYIWLRS